MIEQENLLYSITALRQNFLKIKTTLNLSGHQLHPKRTPKETNNNNNNKNKSNKYIVIIFCL